MTNADRIRNMSDEELNKFISATRCCSMFGMDCGYPVCPSMEGKYCRGIARSKTGIYTEWLKKEAKNERNEID